MEEFCEAAGHKVNTKKSKLFVSGNVPRGLAIGLSLMTTIPLSPSLGKYLGMPLIHKRITKSTYQFLLVKTLSKSRADTSIFVRITSSDIIIFTFDNAFKRSNCPLVPKPSAVVPYKAIHGDIGTGFQSSRWSRVRDGNMIRTLPWIRTRRMFYSAATLWSTRLALVLVWRKGEKH